MLQDMIENGDRVSRFARNCNNCPGALARVFQDFIFLAGKFDLRMVEQLLVDYHISKTLIRDFSISQMLHLNNVAKKYKLENISKKIP